MQSKKLVSLGVSLLLVVILSLFWGLVVSTESVMAQTRTAQDQQQSAPQAANTCLACHNNPTVTAIFSTPHGVGSIAGSASNGRGCESCHGASGEHASTMQSPAVVFGDGGGRFTASDVEIQNRQCLSCHQTTETVHWAASAHQSADLACASCHTIHVAPQTALIERTDSGLCLSCHLEQRSQLNRRSHHPVAEGLMSCTSCHNPHGSDTVALLSKSSITDTCTSCHTEERGPFLWEHQPVTEDCTTCHNPHGSTQASLLSVRQPFLCQTCHSEAFHPSSLYNGTGIPPAGAQQNLLGTSCTNCHSVIHGSNHPSGSRLTR